MLWCGAALARSSALAEAASGVGLRLAAGRCSAPGHALDDRLRLPFTQPPDVLRRAIEILAEVAGALPATDPGFAPSRLVV